MRVERVRVRGTVGAGGLAPLPLGTTVSRVVALHSLARCKTGTTRERLTLNYIYERFTARTATGHTHDLQSCTRQLSSSSARLTSLDRGGTSRSSIAAARAALRESVSVTHCRRTSYDRPVRRVDTPRVSSALEPSSSGALSLSTTLNAQRGCGMRLRRAGSGTGHGQGAAGAVSLARAPGVRGDMRSSDLKQIDASPALAQRSFNILNTS